MSEYLSIEYHFPGRRRGGLWFLDLLRIKRLWHAFSLIAFYLCLAVFQLEAELLFEGTGSAFPVILDVDKVHFEDQRSCAHFSDSAHTCSEWVFAYLQLHDSARCITRGRFLIAWDSSEELYNWRKFLQHIDGLGRSLMPLRGSTLRITFSNFQGSYSLTTEIRLRFSVQFEFLRFQFPIINFQGVGNDK